MEWVYLAFTVISVIYSFTQAPKQKAPKPASLADFQVPTAEQGREVVDVMGTVWIDDPNVVWYGDLYTKPIKAKSGK